jgi:DNA replication and repair protein RecF
MKVERIQLRQFRNYRQLDVSFADGINVLVGKNGAGKTNLVEAIDYLSLARSFRTTHDALLIEKGQPFASIQAWIQEDQVKRELGIVITPEGKQISLNQKPLTKVSELTEYMNVILFEPRDVMLFDDSPKVRRQFLDITLAKHSKAYLELITLYEKLLKQRNHLLKLNKIDHAHLAVITEQMVDLSLPIVKARFQYIKDLGELIEKVVKQIKGNHIAVTLQYVPYFALKGDWKTNALQAFKEQELSDIKRKTTQTGIHREDFEVKFQTYDIAEYGSQGENRLIALALKLTPYFLIKDQDKRPIIILDDVLSELDKKTQSLLLEFLNKLGQVFITTTDYPYATGTIYDIQKQNVIRRKT